MFYEPLLRIHVRKIIHGIPSTPRYSSAIFNVLILPCIYVNVLQRLRLCSHLHGSMTLMT